MPEELCKHTQGDFTQPLWIQTYTGARFYPLQPEQSPVFFVDIAHALSMICRFNVKKGGYF